MAPTVVDKLPSYGLGVGLRPTLADSIKVDPEPLVNWLEVISENHMDWTDRKRERQQEYLLEFRKDYPVVLHGVSASLGSADGVSEDYLKALKNLVDKIEPAWVSDHACFGQIGGFNSHDLLPLAYTKESINTLVANIQKVQSHLKRPIGIENISSYLEFSENEMQEWEFLSEVIHKSGCFLLLDINNVFVNANNHGIDPKEFLSSIPHERVQQVHMAGHTITDDLLIDTHDADVREEVFDLFKWYANSYPIPNYMIERDGNVPDWPILKEELKRLEEMVRL